ncbi:MAG: Crp/Fnr family transcriptional regulator [Clostridia bacterium]|nr:Crp/Fnr family transcriptional regulator [Clostridia bacterium]
MYSNNRFKSAIGYIIKGTATAVSDNKNRAHLKTFSKGMSFGAAALFGGNDCYISEITAKTDLEVLFITENELTFLFEKYPQTAINYITFLSERVRFLNKKLNVVSCSGTENTVLKYLTSLADQNGEINNFKNMSLVSKSLGISRASLYRALSDLENNGYIIKENNYIKVIHYEKTN